MGESLTSDIPLKKNQITEERDDLRAYGTDWTRLYEPKPRAIVFPEGVSDLVALVKWARKTKTPLVPSGGRTGLSAGAVAAKGEVVISLDRMRKILNFNAVDRLVHCEAGVPTEALQDFVKQKGFLFPIDLASRGSSQIGGNISTNAGGTKVIQYGHTRDWIAGLKVVTGTGDVLNLNRCLVKDNSGYDLKQLFIAAEGTLGIIAEAYLRLTDEAPETSVMLLATENLQNVMEILQLFRARLVLTGFEFFTDIALGYVMKAQNYEAPFQKRYPIYALLEFENPKGELTDLALELFEQAQSSSWVIEGVMSQSREQAETFWKYRENISESLAPLKPYKNDISVQISAMPRFVEECEALLTSKYPRIEFVWFGHIGDGNLHINLLPKGQSEVDFRKVIEPMSHDLFGLLKKFNGSLSAEHGIGLVKKPYLTYTLSPEEISFMKGIKRVFDPDGILNPGKIFDA